MFGLLKNYKNKNILNFIDCLNDKESTESYNIFIKHPEVYSYPLTLHFAAYYKHKLVVKELINASRPINLCDTTGYNALHYALCMRPCFEDIKFLKKNENLYTESLLANSHPRDSLEFNIEDDEIIEVIKLLIDAGININKKANNLFTYRPLDIAVEHGSLEIIKYLIKSGVKTNYWDCYSWREHSGFDSVLHRLMFDKSYYEDEYEAFKLLHKSGARLELTIKDSFVEGEEFFLPKNPIQPKADYFRKQLLSRFKDSKKIYQYILNNTSEGKDL